MTYVMSACKFCGKKKQRVVFSFSRLIYKQSFQLIRCEKCNLITLYPFLTQKALYSRYYQSYRSPATGQRFFFLLDYIMKIWRILRASRILKLCKNGPILDVGCGQGVELTILKKWGAEVYGLEYNKLYANKIGLQTGVKIYHGNLSHIPKASKSFGLISFLHSLEHIPEALDYLKDSQHLLKKNGHLLISIPNFSSFESRLFGNSWFHLDIPRHLYHFSEIWFINYLSRLNFRLIGKKHIAPEYDFYSLLQSSLNRLFPSDQNLLYKILLREERKTLKDFGKLLIQTPAIVIFSIISFIVTPILWLIGGNGTIEMVFQKNK